MSPFASLFKKKGKREKEHRMLKHGARLLQEIIAACDGNICYPINMFSAYEIGEAMGGVYHYINGSFSLGYLSSYEDRQIFIKCPSKIENAIFNSDKLIFNEISTVVQLNHRNVVKLLGCCFEMEYPIMIYELLPNTLCDLLHQANPQGPIAWENRFRIAIEIADAVTYLHIAKPRPIIHRDISSSHILLDEHYRPKLCGFSLSIAIPLGETHVEDAVVGTKGYGDPHYISTGQVTEKVDVYDFGCVLLELLTGKRWSELRMQAHDPHELNEMAYDESNDDGPDLIKSETPEREEENRFNFILDSRLSSMDEKKVEQWKACMDIALSCINHEKDQRPTMKEVAQQLRQTERYQLHLPSSSSS